MLHHLDEGTSSSKEYNNVVILNVFKWKIIRRTKENGILRKNYIVMKIVMSWASVMANFRSIGLYCIHLTNELPTCGTKVKQISLSTSVLICA